MEIRQLQHLLAVADEGSFTRAAARLHLSQPGLSASIKTLELELGTQLFVRHGRRVDLTESGRALYSGARRVLAALDATKAQVAGGSRGVQRTLSVGSIPLFAGLDLAALIRKFTARHPEVVVAVTVGFPVDLMEKVRQGEIDLAFVTMPRRVPEDLSLLPVATYPMVLACPLGHRLADRPVVDFATLESETFVDFDPVLAAREVTDDAFHAAGIQRRIAATSNEIGSLLELVAHGLGVAIVPRPLALATRVPIQLVRLTGTSLVWSVAVATKAGGFRSEDALALWNEVSAVATPVSGEAGGLGPAV